VSPKNQHLNLLGVKCPLNWARAKVRLEFLSDGDQLELVIDDPKGRRDIPRAAEAEGYAVVEISQLHDLGNQQTWKMVIEK